MSFGGFLDFVNEPIDELATTIGLKGPSPEDMRREAERTAQSARNAAYVGRDDSSFVSDITGRREARGGAARAAGANFGADVQRQHEARNQQQGLVNMLQQQAAGQGPTVAGLQQQAGMDRALSNQLAMAANARGGNQAGLALRNAQQNAGQMQLQQNNAAAQLRAQEMLAARQQLGGQLGDVRKGDLASAALLDARQRELLKDQDQLDLQNAGLYLNSFGLGTGLAGQQANAAAQQAGATAGLISGILGAI